MWPDEEPYDGSRGRGSSGSEVVITGDGQTAPAPTDALPRPGRPYFINSMNVSSSPGARIGDNYVTVTNIHHTDEVVKVMPCGKYAWAYVKNSTRAERICCSVSVALLAVSLALAVYFGVYYNANPKPFDDENWYIPRTVWLAEAYNNVDIPTEFEPLRLVVIQHTAGPVCYTFQQCCTEVRNLQNWFINEKDRDIPYNFLIGNDGRVYEGRSWHKEGAFLVGYNKCSVGIGFMGDYREEVIGHVKVTESQQIRLYKILDVGIELGYLHPEYKVIGAKDLHSDPNYQSPGSNLYNAMQQWPHFDDGARFKLKNCSQITEMAFL